MNKLYFALAVVLFTAASAGSRADTPAASVAEPPNAAAKPVGQAPMVEMPLKGDEPMPIKMKDEGMKKEDVKKEYMKKEPMIEEIMEKGEMKK